METFYENDKIEIGLDEAGRGCLFGPVCSAGVVWNGDFHKDIKDSKKLSLKKRIEMKDYIMEHAISFNVQMVDNEYIDKYNILQSTMKGWHNCISNIEEDIKIDLILVDGPNFYWYIDKDDDIIPHININGGDNKYIPIAAASILAKTFRDEYIDTLVDENPELEKYDLKNNKGYGTKNHIEAIKEHGLTKWHRKTFGLCKNYK
jgi:ribonuclease HII